MILWRIGDERRTKHRLGKSRAKRKKVSRQKEKTYRSVDL
jgi:hypothetical protein